MCYTFACCLCFFYRFLALTMDLTRLPLCLYCSITAVNLLLFVIVSFALCKHIFDLTLLVFAVVSSCYALLFLFISYSQSFTGYIEFFHRIFSCHLCFDSAAYNVCDCRIISFNNSNLHLKIV